ncbi:cell surface protein [Acephala macrosclerotiorum]|nr:cell surface protein [Acephala macrosclerotiorum]
MQYKFILAALVASPLVAAHGKVSVVTGDAGGNGTALGIQGGVVPGTGSNSKTEVDTTVFSSVKAATDGLGRTTGGGKNTVADATAAMAASGSTLPQVSSGGSLSGTLHVVTTDGAGPFSAIVDPTGTGAFSTGTKATVTQQVPGNNGNISPNGTVRRLLARMGLMKRAANVNKDFPFKVAIPAGTTCSGTVGGQSGVCLVKIANSNPAGPFGGVVAIQMSGAAAGNTTATAAKKVTA